MCFYKKMINGKELSFYWVKDGKHVVLSIFPVDIFFTRHSILELSNILIRFLVKSSCVRNYIIKNEAFVFHFMRCRCRLFFL